ncbi:hypothetical protein PV797_09880 [Clostridiaceae bacterium M8S5]|nr:hypothetical protein PV797_09880 [Clostridiaceae bacterium M8S5]
MKQNHFEPDKRSSNFRMDIGTDFNLTLVPNYELLKHTNSNVNFNKDSGKKIVVNEDEVLLNTNANDPNP